ncbi:MAG: tRNA 5-methoxyuridine(34)/uridine 5-oxyacetic acid(34) synthase CmoB [Gammaproteobacteria bacterium]|nr:tRNA 5-methoxyuridine(34)/uridine 5-oxyacetic acid(34) synthase CmoB [Gammaproteobacteria bacterium]
MASRRGDPNAPVRTRGRPATSKKHAADSAAPAGTSPAPRVLDTLFEAWRAAGAEYAVEALRNRRHGDLPRWMAALETLPDVRPTEVSLGATVSAGGESLNDTTYEQLHRALRGLIPWRKGPFHLFGIDIDSEWRSDLKWARIVDHLDLDGSRVLDVGSGNGYYGWRMLEAGARSVTGIDPSQLATLQHAAVAHYMDRGAAGIANRNTVLPVRLEDFEAGEPYDVVFSMGVVYHRRDPMAHVQHLVRHTHARTTLVLESLVVDGAPLEPRERYARMRNIWLVPDIGTLCSWLEAVGFGFTQVADVSPTTPREQRSTDWMPFESLRDALDRADPALTIEGYPAPKRAVMIARRP